MSLLALPSEEISGDITEKWMETGYRLYICNFFWFFSFLTFAKKKINYRRFLDFLVVFSLLSIFFGDWE
jgi:hypothetical protein